MKIYTTTTLTLPQVRDENYDYYLTRSFMDNIKKIVGGKNLEVSIFIVNTLGKSEELKKAQIGKPFNIKILDVFNVLGIKSSSNEVTFSDMVVCK